MKKILAVQLLGQVEQVFEHASKANDFSHSKENMDEWWWHLDALLKGEILFHAQSLYDEVI